MPKSVMLLMLSVVIMTGCSCATGDPTAGGWLCWSQEKNDRRIEKQEYDLKYENWQKTELEAENQRLKAELDSIEKRFVESQTPSPAEEAEMKQLKDEIGHIEAIMRFRQ